MEEVDILVVGLGPAGSSVISNLGKALGSEFSILGVD